MGCPLHVLGVLRPADRIRRIRRWRCHRWSGRELDLAVALEQLKRVEAGTPASLLVRGEAGIGKSRLVAELAARARQLGHTVLARAGRRPRPRHPLRRVPRPAGPAAADGGRRTTDAPRRRRCGGVHRRDGRRGRRPTLGGGLRRRGAAVPHVADGGPDGARARGPARGRPRVAGARRAAGPAGRRADADGRAPCGPAPARRPTLERLLERMAFDGRGRRHRSRAARPPRDPGAGRRGARRRARRRARRGGLRRQPRQPVLRRRGRPVVCSTAARWSSTAAGRGCVAGRARRAGCARAPRCSGGCSPGTATTSSWPR